MSEVVTSVIVPATTYERDCIEGTLECITTELATLDQPSELIVVANRCNNDTNAKAARFFLKTELERRQAGVKGRLFHTAAKGKMHAINHGIRRSRGLTQFVMDSDTTVDSGAIRWATEALEDPSVQAVTLHHAPAEKSLPKDDELARVITMNTLRRLAFPEKHWLHGAFMGWRSDLRLQGLPLHFPEGVGVPDDAWLTAAILNEHGDEAIVASREYKSRFIPPQNWDDYYSQQWRYQQAAGMVGKAFPELSGATPSMKDRLNKKYPEEWIDEKWRTSCKEHGIDFDAFHPFYVNVLTRVRQGQPERGDEIDAEGIWQPQVTTKVIPTQ